MKTSKGGFIHRFRPDIALAALGAGLWLASRDEQFVLWYHDRIGPAITSTLTIVTERTDTSIADVVLLAVAAYIVFLVIRGLIGLLRPRFSRWRALGTGAARLIRRAAIVVISFYALWGIHYAVPALTSDAERFPVQDLGPDESSRQLELHATRFVDRANVLYRTIHGADDAGTPTTPIGSARRRDAEIDRSLAAVGKLLDLGPAFDRRHGPAKPVRLGPVMSRLGLSGFYFPWTGEANYNPDIPAWQIPHTIAHEKCHQRGITNEGEANFIAALSNMESSDPFVRYSGLLFAQRQLLTQLLLVDIDRAKDLIERRLPGVQRDVNATREFWAGYRGVLSKTATGVNDRFLRINRIEGGVASYGMSARLFILWLAGRGDESARPQHR